MTGRVKHKCPICGKPWIIICIPGISQSSMYVVKYCSCKETLGKFQKAFNSSGTQVSYAY